VTLSASDDLKHLRDEFSKYPTDARVSLTDKGRLHDVMDRLRYTLRAEASTLHAYVLDEKRIDVQKLVNEPDFFFAHRTFERLPDIARFDVREAGKCIAFDLPTAGAFHLLRATEDTLRSYFRTFFKRASIETASWGQLLERLRAKARNPKPDATLLHHLDHIRKNFRNPTDHPQMIFDTDQVQDLLALVADVLNRMAKELPEVERGVLDDFMLPHITSLLVGVPEEASGARKAFPPELDGHADAGVSPDRPDEHSGGQSVEEA